MAGPGEHVSTGEKTQARASEVMDEARSRAHEKVRGTAKRGLDMWESQKRMAAVEVDGYACALKEAARSLHDQQQDSVAHYVERAADGLDHLAHNLREQDFGNMVNRFSDFARRQPGVFLGSAVAAGFLLSRFLKSSAEEGREYEKSWPEELAEERYHKPEEGERPSPEVQAASGPYTAADVEVPVIIQPHGDGEHRPGGPKP